MVAVYLTAVTESDVKPPQHPPTPTIADNHAYGHVCVAKQQSARRHDYQRYRLRWPDITHMVHVEFYVLYDT